MSIILSISDERRIICIGAAPASRRYCIYCYPASSERSIFVNYTLQAASVRKCTYQEPVVISERHACIPDIYYSYSDMRACVSGGGLPSDNQRTCVYVPGVQVVSFVVPISLSITYDSERGGFCCQSPISQRRVCLIVEAHSERISFISIKSESHIYQPEVLFSQERIADRTCFVETLDRSSTRLISLMLQVNSDRHVYCSALQEGVIFTSYFAIGKKGITSDRVCAYKTLNSFSERTILAQGSPFSERRMKFTFTTHTDREMVYVVDQQYQVHSFLMVQARPTPSERWCSFKSIIYNTERYVFVETRNRYSVKRPSTVTNALSVSDEKDIRKQYVIKSDRDLHVTGSSVTIEKTNRIDRSKVIVGSNSTTLNITAVDNLGGSISTTSDQKIFTLKNSAKLMLNISLLYYNERVCITQSST